MATCRLCKTENAYPKNDICRGCGINRYCLNSLLSQGEKFERIAKDKLDNG